MALGAGPLVSSHDIRVSSSTDCLAALASTSGLIIKPRYLEAEKGHFFGILWQFFKGIYRGNPTKQRVIPVVTVYWEGVS